MLQITKLVFAALTAFNVSKSGMLKGIYPILAPINVKHPFLVFKVEKSVDETKSGVVDMFVEIAIVGLDHDELCEIADEIDDLFSNEHNFIFQSTTAGANPDYPDEKFFKTRFNIKMINK
tara:strand:- start:8888 stop:9247 length:360 start_codon:yes stop_codon:yes gene_type:complete